MSTTRKLGGLKLKGDDGPIKKKKKKSSSSKKFLHKDTGRDSDAHSSRNLERGVEEEEEEEEGSHHPPTTSSRSSIGTVGGGGGGKTEAQRRFEEVQKKRLLEKAAKAAAKSHKERVEEFNSKLERLSEHYDIPKVGPG